mmetsp:Transcript_24621/g.46246  ORF Transcript_24621/g.46246 Transcript_24621/m.46246 type:complete len:279 (-) Transcript_24621:23-859(-)
MKCTTLLQRFEGGTLRFLAIGCALLLCVVQFFYVSEHINKCTQKSVTSGSQFQFPSLAGNRGRSRTSESSIADVGNLKGQWHVQDLRAAYYGVMGSSIGNEVMPNGHLANIEGLTGLTALQSPGRGRGLFATVAYKKGDRISDDEIYSGYFSTGQQYRDYLLALPRNLACEVTRWSYTFVASPNTGHSGIPGREPNTVALKDISPGDEILVDYTKYEAHAWSSYPTGCSYEVPTPLTQASPNLTKFSQMVTSRQQLSSLMLKSSRDLELDEEFSRSRI